MPTDTIKSNKIFYKHPVLRLYVFSTRCFFFQIFCSLTDTSPTFSQ